MIKMGHIERFVLALCVLLASSCMACGHYKYFGFASTPGITVLETRVPNLTGLRDVKPFPISYELKRDDYRVILRIYERDSGPTVTFVVVSSIPKTLRIIDVPLGANKQACVSHIEQSGSTKISWLGWEGCKEDGSLSIAVIDESGKQIAVEGFSFSVITNGRTCVRDGL